MGIIKMAKELESSILNNLTYMNTYEWITQRVFCRVLYDVIQLIILKEANAFGSYILFNLSCQNIYSAAQDSRMEEQSPNQLKDFLLMNLALLALAPDGKIHDKPKSYDEANLSGCEGHLISYTKRILQAHFRDTKNYIAAITPVIFFSFRISVFLLP